MDDSRATESPKLPGRWNILLHPSPQFATAAAASCRVDTPLSIRSTLPFPPDKARFHHHLSAAIDVAERAYSLCVDVKKSLLSSTDRILKKSNQTPVTITDFGVQALISLELGKLFPDIPLVAEEDSSSLRSSSVDSGGDSLVDYVVNAVVDKASIRDWLLTTMGGRDHSRENGAEGKQRGVAVQFFEVVCAGCYNVGVFCDVVMVEVVKRC